MADETLSAAIKVRDRASSDLRRIANSFDDVAENAVHAAEGSFLAADAFDEAEDEASSLARSLRSLAGSAAMATGALTSVSAAAGALDGGMDGAEDETNELNRALLQTLGLAPMVAAAMAGQGAAGMFGGGGGDSGLEQTLDSTEMLHDALLALDRFETTLDVERSREFDEAIESAQRADRDRDRDGGHVIAGMDLGRVNRRETLSGIRRRALGEESDFGFSRMFNVGQGGRLDWLLARDPTADVDPDEFDEHKEAIRDLGEAIGDLPTMQVPVEDAEGFERFANQLRTIDDEALHLSETLERLDDKTADHLIRNAESAHELRRGLSRTSFETEKTERSLEGLEGASRDLMDEMIAGAKSADEFDGQIEEIGTKASKTGGQLLGLDGILKNHAINTMIAAETTDKLGDELQETGNEALTAMMKVGASEAALGSFQNALGKSTARIGPFRASLSSLAQMLPMIISLVTVLGGVLTTAIGGGLGLVGILGGGLLALGEQTADRMEATATATGEAGAKMERLQNATSDAERAMIGVQELMGDIRDAAFEALAPLRQPIFAEFTTKAINQALTLLGEFAQAVAWGAEPLMEMADLIGAAWWDTYPEFMDALVRLMGIVAPMLADLAVRAIEALPGILDAMATHSEILLPKLIDLGDAVIDLLPALLELGTMMLRGILPNLIGFVRGIGLLVPLISLFARVIGEVVSLFDPIIEGLFMAGGAAMVLNSTLPFLILLLKGVRLVTKALLLKPLAGFFWGAVKAALYLKWAVAGLTAALGTLGATLAIVSVIGAVILAIAALLSYFDLWDEAIEIGIKAWNKWVDIVNFAIEFIAAALVGLYNLGVWVFNGLSKMITWIGKRLGMIASNAEAKQYDYAEKPTREGNYLDPSKADEYAAMVPGQDNSTPTPYGEGEGQGGRSDRSGGEEPWRTKNEITVNNYGEMDDRRVEEAVRRGVQQADKRKRRQSTPMN